MIRLYNNVERQRKPQVAYIIGLYYQDENNRVEAKDWFELAFALAESWASQDVLDKYTKAAQNV